MAKMGKCHICGTYSQLTFEHVPPRAAFNKHKQFVYFGEEIIARFGSERLPWDFSYSKGKQKQGGVGFNTLCTKCNNDTGGWYANAFVDFIYKGYKDIINKRIITNTWVTINFERIYPLRVIKQILAMFFSINNPSLGDVEEELRTFVLGKDTRGLSNKYGIYIYILNGMISRYIGVASILSCIGMVGVDKRIRVVSELSAPPFGYVLEFEPKYYESGCDLRFFSNEFSYRDEATVNLRIPVLECNTEFPIDYRTKEQVLLDYIRNKRKK